MFVTETRSRLHFPWIVNGGLVFAGGNQRELARAKAAKKTGEKKQPEGKLVERRER